MNEFIERPILFNGDMVRAILDGRKTQTRRIVKGVNLDSNGPFEAAMMPGSIGLLGYCGFILPGVGTKKFKCPFGKRGDRLWVRESFYQAGEWCQSHPEDDKWAQWNGHRIVHYHADGPPPVVGHNAWGSTSNEGKRFKVYKDDMCWRSRPSIHMPRWASRITLEIKNVRVERLQGISAKDALAEGITWPGTQMFAGINKESKQKNQFQYLWESVYGDESWKSNPWVWVVEFERIK